MVEKISLRKQYENWNTKTLLEMHASGSLTEDAYEVLEEVLRERSIYIPVRPSETQINRTNRTNWEKKILKNAALCAQIGAIFGVLVPIIRILLAHFFNIGIDASPAGVIDVLMLPAMIVLSVTDNRDLMGPVVLLAIAVNACVFAGWGWLMGYGWTRW